MVSNPDQWVNVFAEAGAGTHPSPHPPPPTFSLNADAVDLYCFHIEALHSEQEINDIISHIKAKGMKVGIAIKPKTPSTVLYPYIPKIDMALVMVFPPPPHSILGTCEMKFLIYGG